MAETDDCPKTQDPRALYRLPPPAHCRNATGSETFCEVEWRAVCGESRKHGSEGGQGFLRVRLPYPTVVILLDRKNAPIGINTVSIGSLTASVVHMRETFKAAILANAAAILCGHNHISGDPEPSREDRALTQRLVKAGTLLGIPVVDHVVLGDGTLAYFSFADHG